MAKKKHLAIYVPGAPGRTGIFIHQGSKPAHSDGCLVIAKDRILKIAREVGSNKKNVTVVVKDPPGPSDSAQRKSATSTSKIKG